VGICQRGNARELRTLSSVPAGQAHICQNLRIIGIDQTGRLLNFVKIPASISGSWMRDSRTLRAILDPLAMRCTRCWPAGGGQTVLVTGCGDWVDGHRSGKACGSSTVFATETMRSGARWRRKWARRCAESAAEDAVQKFWRKRGHGVDALLEMSGIPPRFSRVSSAASGGRVRCWGFQRKMCR